MQRYLKQCLPGAIALTILLALSPRSSGADAPLPPTNMEGLSGLIRIPTAEVLPYGYYKLVLNMVNGKHRFYWGPNTVAHLAVAGVIPRVEVAGGIMNHDGRLGVQYKDPLPWGIAGWNFDRQASIQVLVLPQTAAFPVSVAVGAQDFIGNDVFKARYLVVSRRSRAVGLHLGLSDGAMGPLLGGVDYQPIPSLRLMLDHDGNRANFGLTWQSHRFAVTPILTGLRALGGGITYTQHI